MSAAVASHSESTRSFDDTLYPINNSYTNNKDQPYKDKGSSWAATPAAPTTGAGISSSSHHRLTPTINSPRMKSAVGTVRTFGSSARISSSSPSSRLHHHQPQPQEELDTQQATSRRPLQFLFNHSTTDSSADANDLSTNTHVPSLQHNNDFFGTLFSLSSSSGVRHFEPSNQLKFILNCCMWYVASSLTNNTGKQILNVFRYPVTLTFLQFGLVAVCCFTAARLFGATHIRPPTSDITRTIVPLAVFLIVGHVFSSIAISRIPVSMVHTIKALAPLFTVLFYRFIFRVSYTKNVYVSLLPLTLGVILACSFTFSNNMMGLACALGSCLVFVTQNIFSKKILFKESKLGDRNPNKLDKMNVLFYSSSISFLLMIPLWLYSDGQALFGDKEVASDGDISVTRLIYYFLLNGTMNFGQNWFAFTTLSLTSPVTYSILSLLKRIFVIVMSIVWFGQQVSWTQSFGILLTFGGLWLYQQAKKDVDRGEREKSIEMLPTSLVENGKSL